MSNDTNPLDNSEMPEVGDVLEGRYRLESVLATGGMGIIILARQLAMDRNVVVKLLHPRYVANEKVVARFEREVDIAKHLNHPHTIQLFDFGRSESGHLYIVMEYLQGRDLKEVMNRAAPLPLGRATDIMLQALDGLAEAHEHGVVHRDLKPSNIFVQENSRGEDYVKVLDFGIAKSLEVSSNLTATGEICGTAQYMAPEVILRRAADKASDVYAMGLIFLEMLRGRRIFSAESIGQTILMHMKQTPPIPQRLAHTPAADVIETAAAKHPDARYEDAVAMLDALQEVRDRIPRGLTLTPGEFDAFETPDDDEMLHGLERVELALESAESLKQPTAIMRELEDEGTGGRTADISPSSSANEPTKTIDVPDPGTATERHGGAADERPERAPTVTEDRLPGHPPPAARTSGPPWEESFDEEATTRRELGGDSDDGSASANEGRSTAPEAEESHRIGPTDDTVVLGAGRDRTEERETRKAASNPSAGYGEPSGSDTASDTPESLDTASLYPSGWENLLDRTDKPLLLLIGGVVFIVAVGIALETCTGEPDPAVESSESRPLERPPLPAVES